MKKLLMAAPFGLVLAIASGTAAAATGSGTIYFTGKIESGTCSVEVTTPGSPAGNRIFLGQAMPSDFVSVGTEVHNTPFSMAIAPGSGCTIADGVATVNFASNDGADANDSKLHAVRPGTAKGVGVVIRHADDQSIIAHGTDSKEFVTQDDTPLLMKFTAGYMSSLAAAAIVPGDAYADINFTVTLP